MTVSLAPAAVTAFAPSILRQAMTLALCAVAATSVQAQAPASAAPPRDVLAQPGGSGQVFAIAGGPLDLVLNEFGRQAGLLLTFPADLVAGMQSPGLHGRYEPQAGLALLLVNTGLQAVDTGSGGLMLRRPPKPKSGGAVAQMDLVTVTGVDSSVYDMAGAHSSRNMNQNMQSLDSTLRSMAGTYTQLDPLQGTVNVNIRGMSGLGRVNTMVDGVTQTFYGVAPVSYHGSGTNSSAGVLIDPSFLVGVDVTRGSSAGSQGVNSLVGSANMRTIGIDDVLTDGRQIGMLGRYSLGSNGLGRNGMVAVAGRTQAFSDTGSIGALVGVSASTIHATYSNGSGRDSADFMGEDSQYMKQNPKSQLYKIDIRPDGQHRLELNGRNYTNAFTRRDIKSDDYSLRYSFASHSPWLNPSVLLSTSRSTQDYEPGAPSTYDEVSVKNRSNALDISNSSRITLGDYGLGILVGGKLMDTRYQRSFLREFEDEGRNAFMPQGKQRIASLYTGLTVNKSIYQLDLGLNYTRSHVIGTKPACPATINCFPQGAAELNLKDTAFNPSATFSAQLTPWLQPFVTYSRSARAPNVQEVFFANEGGGSMNPFLKPEHAQTWQFGFNLKKEGLIFARDSFQLKALTYRTRVKDYIASESFFLCYDGSRCKDIENSSPDFNAHMSVNTLSPVTTRGHEIEASYDAGVAYVNLAWSRQNTNQPTSITSTTQLGFGYDDMSDLPRSYATIDIGGRFFERKLVVGGLIKYTGRSQRLSTEGINVDTGRVEKEDMPRIPTIVDLYASYQLTDDILLRASVQNLGNKDYADALHRMNQDLYYAQEGTSINTTARGRTYLVGAEIRF